MRLREREEREVVTYVHVQRGGSEAEGEEGLEGAMDGDYLLPTTLFEANKDLFDLGMVHFFAVSS
jgi:hypothetical protein